MSVCARATVEYTDVVGCQVGNRMIFQRRGIPSHRRVEMTTRRALFSRGNQGIEISCAQKVIPLEAIFAVILLWKYAKSFHRKEDGVVVVGLWIVWAGTLLVAVHTIHSQACQCSFFSFRAGTLEQETAGMSNTTCVQPSAKVKREGGSAIVLDPRWMAVRSAPRPSRSSCWRTNSGAV